MKKVVQPKCNCREQSLFGFNNYVLCQCPHFAVYNILTGKVPPKAYFSTDDKWRKAKKIEESGR